jgi:transposase
MKNQDIIMAKAKELKKLHIVRKFIEKQIKQTEASKVLGISTRQVRRIAARLKAEGDSSIAHRLRGKKSNNATSESVRQKVVTLYKKNYWDFGPTLASEKLSQVDGIKVSKETLRSWLISEGLLTKRRKPRYHRKWRERKPHFGQMVQMDGSEHDWFEDRGGRATLMGYIDDATNTVFARFYSYEGVIPAMDSFIRYIDRYGLPASIYFDRHTTYKSSGKPTIEDQLLAKVPLSQFARALDEMGVRFIYAYSPQAKGRIERLFGTFQDRVIKEMRLAGVCNIVEGNNFLDYYLPIFNNRFSIPPAEESNMHGPVPKDIDLKSIFSIREERILRNDFTISYKTNLYQILDNIYAKKVTVEERLDENIYITYKGKDLRYKRIEKRPIIRKEKVLKERRAYIPPPDHPWKRNKPGVWSYY